MAILKKYFYNRTKFKIWKIAFRKSKKKVVEYVFDVVQYNIMYFKTRKVKNNE